MNNTNMRVIVCLLANLFLWNVASAGKPDLADAIQAKAFDDAVRMLKGESNSESLDINAAQADGMTALHWAVHHNEIELAKLLVEKKARVDLKNRYGVTALWLACQNGNAESVKLLLSAGADPNTALPNGETVLMTAARTGRVAPVKALIAAGAEVNAKEKRNRKQL